MVSECEMMLVDSLSEAGFCRMLLLLSNTVEVHGFC